MEICPKETCTGCLACYNACSHNAIELHKDEEGFLYPDINSMLCVDCGLCKSVCPVVAGTDDVVNKPLVTYAAWNKNRHIVRKSSSGGLFTSIAEWVLSKDGIVYGAAFDEKLQVKHMRVDNISDLEKVRGSKYVQSFMGNSYQQAKEDLRKGRWVLFSGTPCQVAGLKKLITTEDSVKLITIDLVCHGVPSPLMFDEYKNYLEKKYDSKINSYCFRDKKWSWNHYNMRATFENGAEYIGKWEEDFFSRGFLRDYYLRPACHTCHFTNTMRGGDFTLADFWGFRSRSGEKRDEDKGVSMILVNTKKGEGILEDVKESLYFYTRTIEEAKSGNESLYTPFEKSPLRDTFWRDYREYGYTALLDKYFYPEKMSKAMKRIYRYGRFIGTILNKIQKIKNLATNYLRK